MTITPAEFDRDVRLFIYQRFIEQGAPPSVDDTAREIGARPGEVMASLDRLAAAHVLVLKPGTHDIWMANPLSSVPTPFRVTTAGQSSGPSAPRGSWWGNCIWDALGIAAMLDTSAAIATRCPDCDEPQALLVNAGSLAAEGVVHFAVPARSWWDDIGFT